MTPTPTAAAGLPPLPELPPFSQLVSHMLRDYVPSSVELQVAVAIRAYATAYALAALSALPQPAIPGWQLVPVEPTEAMKLAGYYEANDDNAAMCGLIYQAMLASAPQPAAQQGKIQDHLAACDRGGVTQWQAVETAPARAEPLLALSESGRMSIQTGHWLRNLLHASKVDGDECNYTHWMPLPAAPTGEGA